MNETLERFRLSGCDIDGALNRFMYDEKLYISFLDQALNDPAYEELRICIQNGDIQTAYDKAHMLKGMLGNMGLTPAYVSVSELTTLLNSKLLEKACEKYTKFEKTIEALKEQRQQSSDDIKP